MNAKELVEMFRRVFDAPHMTEETVCKTVYDLAMRSYYRGDYHRDYKRVYDMEERHE